MATVLVYRSNSASYAAKRVAAAAPGITAVQQDHLGDHGRGDVLVRWDCYENLPPHNARDLNPARAVQGARNKIAARAILGDLSPETWTDIGSVRLPCVIRPTRHKEGKHFFVCNTPGEVRAAVQRLRRLGWYGSTLIHKAREFRVFVVEGRVVAVSERFPANSTDVAWNLARGGRLVNVARGDWPVEVLRASVEACNRLGLGFGAVDACIDRTGRVYVFEVNTSPALKNKFTIKQIARGLAAAGRELPPIKATARKPRSFAHPAILAEGEDAPPSRPTPAAPAPQAPPAPAAAPSQPVVVQAPPVPQGAAMPAASTAVLHAVNSATDHIRLQPGESKVLFLERAAALFDNAYDREREERRREAQSELARLQLQIATLQQRINSGNF